MSYEMQLLNHYIILIAVSLEVAYGPVNAHTERY